MTANCSDIFEVQDEIARTIADRLKVTLGPEKAETLVRSETRDLEAYQLYLKGRFHWNKRSADGLQKAIEYFQQAIGKDPSYAVAYAGLADAYNMISFRNVLAPHAVMPKAKAAATKALELDRHRAEPSRFPCLRLVHLRPGLVRRRQAFRASEGAESSLCYGARVLSALSKFARAIGGVPHGRETRSRT